MVVEFVHCRSRGRQEPKTDCRPVFVYATVETRNSNPVPLIHTLLRPHPGNLSACGEPQFKELLASKMLAFPNATYGNRCGF